MFDGEGAASVKQAAHEWFGACPYVFSSCAFLRVDQGYEEVIIVSHFPLYTDIAHFGGSTHDL